MQSGCVRSYLLGLPRVRTILFFFFNDTATTEIYTLSLHDALPISRTSAAAAWAPPSRSRSAASRSTTTATSAPPRDRKSTRLNSSHGYISYAVFCLKKKKHTTSAPTTYSRFYPGSVNYASHLTHIH